LRRPASKVPFLLPLRCLTGLFSSALGFSWPPESNGSPTRSEPATHAELCDE
jgi:hypothetical protein